jgi:hypothetical protein
MMQVHRRTDWEDLSSSQSSEGSVERNQQAALRLAAITYERVRRSGLGDELALQAAVYSVVLVSDDMPSNTVSEVVRRAIAWVKGMEIRAENDF